MNHLPVSAYSVVLTLGMKIFVNVARLEIGQLFTQGARLGHPCTLDTFLVSNGPGHMTKMATMPIYGKKTLKNVLRNQKADDLESWYAASGAQCYQVCSNDDPGLTLTYFTTRSNLVPQLLYGKKVKQWIFQKLL